jgi:short-subunit dehydrogenase
MRPRGHGHIVNVASMAGTVALSGAAVYSASKHAVVGFCDSLAYELRGSGVELSYLLPGMVDTELASGILRSRVAGTIAPEKVAAEIVRVVRHPRRVVYVPRHLGISRMTALLPKAAAERIAIATGADRLLTDSLGSPDRQRYAARVAASAPGAETRRSRG